MFGSHDMLLPTYNCSVLQSRFRYLGFCVAPAPQGAGSKVSMVPALCAHQTWHTGKHGFFHQNGFFLLKKKAELNSGRFLLREVAFDILMLSTESHRIMNYSLWFTWKRSRSLISSLAILIRVTEKLWPVPGFFGL